MSILILAVCGAKDAVDLNRLIYLLLTIQLNRLTVFWVPLLPKSLSIACWLVKKTHYTCNYICSAYIMAVHDITGVRAMSTIQIRVDDELKKEAYQAFEKLNLSPSDALRLFLRYVAENEKLPFAEVSVMVSEDDEDADILAVVRERLKNPTRRIRVNVDDL